MAIAITAAEIIAMAPEFTGLTQPEADVAIALAREFVSEAAWKTDAKAKQALILMTCHILKELGIAETGTGSDGSRGQVISERVGDLQVSYGQMNLLGSSEGSKLLMSTKYGSMFLMLRRTLGLSPRVT